MASFTDRLQRQSLLAVKRVICRNAPVPTWIYVHPLRDYEPVQPLPFGWLGSPRGGFADDAVAITSIYNASITAFSVFATLQHTHIASPIAFYCVNDVAYVASEYATYSLPELSPLSQAQAAAVMSQVRRVVGLPVPSLV